ncbi:MAG: TIGR03084 family metal-binding protein [Rhizobiaceae bacterium]|nr:TIGR03084 family metal-binding protein [Rhizobiaceae bacterium]
MQQAADFLEESEVLIKLVSELDEAQFDMPTQFKGWTINDILVHLHFWNLGADLSLNDPDAFTTMFDELFGALKAGKLRDHENSKIKERGRELLSLWSDLSKDMGRRWQHVDPKTRVKWAGPDMSVRSSMSARQMEVWAHGQAIFDLLGKDRPEGDRIRNIVMLGVNAFGWSHKVHGLEVPEEKPTISLKSPSGETWVYGDGEDRIDGNAVEFCQVVTQTRNVADTALKVTGTDALRWMENAQCFAGPPNRPPAPGSRYKTKA